MNRVIILNPEVFHTSDVKTFAEYFPGDLVIFGEIEEPIYIKIIPLKP